MPKEYEAIRDSLKKQGKSDKEAKRIAAATYNKRHPNAPLNAQNETLGVLESARLDARRLLSALNEAQDFTASKTELARILKAPNADKGLTRALILKLCPSCPRCGGAGHYSRNAMGDTTCYQCHGNRCVEPRNAKQWAETIENAKRIASTGVLDKYLQSLKIRGEMKQLQDNWFKVWKSSGVDDYNWHKLNEWENTVLGVEGYNRSPHMTGSDWTMLDPDAIRQCFLADVNGYYAVVSEFLSQVSSNAEYSRDLFTAEQLADWFLNVEKARDYVFGPCAQELHALVNKVPLWVKQAKSGTPFPIETDAHGIVVPLWLKTRAPKLLNLGQSKVITQLNALLKQKINIYQMIWPHDKQV